MKPIEKPALLTLGLLLSACSATGAVTVNTPSTSGSAVTVRTSNVSACANEVAVVKLTPSQRQASFNTDVIAPGSFKHMYRVIVVDTTDFTGAGTLKVSGSVGTGTSAASFALLGGAPSYPCTGFGDSSLQGAANIRPGGTFSFSQAFTGGQVYRLTAEGNWDSPENSSNTAALSFSVE